MTRAGHGADRTARFVAFLDRRRAWVLGATAVLMLAGAAGVRQLAIESSFAPFMPADSVHLRALHAMTDAFGDGEPLATPVLANALGLAIGFSVMALSPLQIHVTLAILMWVTMLVSALLSLTLLPTIAAGGPTPVVDAPVTATG